MLRLSHRDPSLDDVPGQKIFGRAKNTPANCRALLGHRAQPNPTFESLTIPPEILPQTVATYTEYQKRGISWLAGREGGHLWWSAGSGKSRPALHSALSNAHKIVWVTISAAKTQVRSEILETTNLQPVDIHVVYGKSEPIPPARILILNWELLPDRLLDILRWAGAYVDADAESIPANWKAAKPGEFAVVLDELHSAKQTRRFEKGVNEQGIVVYNDLGNRSSAASHLAKKACFRLGLTATPIRDNRMDLWSQLDIIEPDCWGRSLEWAFRYCDAKEGKFGGFDTSGASNTEELNLRLREVTNIVKGEEARAALPGMRRRLFYLGPEDQCRPGGEWRKELKAAARSGKEALFAVQRAEAAARKRKWIIDAVVQAMGDRRKVVIFSGLRLDVEALGEGLKQAFEKTFPSGRVPTLWRAHGGEDGDLRGSIKTAYMQHPGPCCLVATGESFGVALNLQDTDLAIMAMLPWNGGQIEQYEGRFVRQGQKRKVEIWYPIAEGTVDEGIADLVLNKLERVVDVDGGSAGGAREVADMLGGADNEDEIMAKLLGKF